MVHINSHDEEQGNSAEQDYGEESEGESAEIEDSATEEKVADAAEAAAEKATDTEGIGGILITAGIVLLLALVNAFLPDTDSSIPHPLLD